MADSTIDSKDSCSLSERPEGSNRSPQHLHRPLRKWEGAGGEAQDGRREEEEEGEERGKTQQLLPANYEPNHTYSGLI